jgi:cytochrome c
VRPVRACLAAQLALVAVLKPGVIGALRADEVDPGKQQFLTSCGTCHSVDDGAGNRQGPNLFGVYGRHVGERADFNYSDTLKAGTWSWTDDTLDQWIENAQQAHPGTIMNYRQANPDRRRLVIEYLKKMRPEN